MPWKFKIFWSKTLSGSIFKTTPFYLVLPVTNLKLPLNLKHDELFVHCLSMFDDSMFFHRFLYLVKCKMKVLKKEKIHWVVWSLLNDVGRTSAKRLWKRSLTWRKYQKINSTSSRLCFYFLGLKVNCLFKSDSVWNAFVLLWKKGWKK